MANMDISPYPRPLGNWISQAQPRSFQMLKKGHEVADLITSEVVEQAFGHQGNFGAVDALDLRRMKDDLSPAGEAQAQWVIGRADSHASIAVTVRCGHYQGVV